MDIYERIKNRRKQLGLSVDYVAKELNVNRATIYRYESSDIGKLPTSIIEPLSKVLQTTPAYLMGWEKDTKSDLTTEESQLLKSFHKLNDLGKREAYKRVSELTEISKYMNTDKKEEYNFAAHNDGLDQETANRTLEKAKEIFKQMDEE